MKLVSRLSLSMLLLAATAVPAAEEKKDIFSDPQNLTVLPDDIGSRELRDTMRGFALALGARCETCHVGEPGQDLSEFDFAADDKDTKLTARQMLKMVATINEDYIAKLDGERVRVECVRCHRGVLKPLLTGELLRPELDDGFDALEAKYRELREAYYGTHSYDFSEPVLVELASSVGVAGDLDSAEAILKLNLEYYPDGFQTHFTLGEVYARRGDKTAARRHLERAQAINPHPMIEQRLNQLDSPES